jgi:HSP20 family protein
MAENSPATASERHQWWPDLIPRRWLDMMDWPLFETRDVARTIRLEEHVEQDGTLVVRAEMPGIDPEQDLEVHVRDHLLEIRAERTQKETKDVKGARQSEFHYGSFYRALRLPSGAKESDVEATYKDGIIEVRVPVEKPTEPPATRVAVKPG